MPRYFVAGLFSLYLMLAALQAGGSGLIKKEDIPKAIELLQKGTVAQRVKAAEDLGNRGAVRVTDVADAIEPLKSRLKRDSEPRVRAASALALGKIQHEPKELVPFLSEALTQDKDASVKLALVQALGSLGPQAKSALPVLRKVQANSDKKLAAAIKAAVKNINKKN